jgi:hypothetical protein
MNQVTEYLDFNSKRASSFRLMRSICLVLTLLYAPMVYSQNTYVLDGLILDSTGVPLEFGNLYIYNPSDSSIIEGALITDGKFVSPVIVEPSVYIKITSFGYTDYFQSAKNAEKADTISIGTIHLVSDITFGPVTVVGETPIFENDGTSTIVNVAKTILSASITPLEILKKSPGILVNGSSVIVLGRGNAALYLNGQKITVDQLNNIPVDQILKFEIIRNPSARYDGDAAAVIKVITKNYRREGTNIGLRQSLTYPPFMSNSIFGINYKKKKLSLNFNYGFTKGEQWNTGLQSTERVGLYATDLDVLETTNLLGHIVSGGIGYELDSNQTITFGYSGTFNAIGIDVLSKNTITSTQVSQYDVSNNGLLNINNNNFVANYTRAFDTLGSNLFVGTQYTMSGFGMYDSITEHITTDNIFLGQTKKRINGENSFNIFSSQVDFEKYTSDKTSFAGGLKYSNAQTSGSFEMDIFSNNTWVGIPLFSSTTKFDENIYAAYSEFKTSWKSLNILVGLRYEHTDAKGITTQQGQLSLDRSYNWFLPSIILSKNVHKKIKLSLSYTTSTGRPSYNDLNPVVFYIDSLTSKQGNPLLLPQRDHAISATINVGPMKLDLTYYRSINAFKDIVREGLTGDNSVTLFKENVDADRLYGTIGIPLKNKVITTYIYYLIGWDKVIGDYGDFTTFDLAPSHYVYMYNQIRVKKLFNIELIGSYSSGRYDGIYKDISSYDLSVGVSREFFKKKLKCQLIANDVFFTQRTAGTYYIGDYSVNYLRKNSSRYVRLSLSYKFGRLKQDQNKLIEVGTGEKDRIK